MRGGVRSSVVAAEALPVFGRLEVAANGTVLTPAMGDGDWTAEQSLGRRVGALLELRGWSRAQLAERLCVPEELVASWLADESLPTLPELMRLVLELRVSSDAVVFGSDRRFWLS